MSYAYFNEEANKWVDTGVSKDRIYEWATSQEWTDKEIETIEFIGRHIIAGVEPSISLSRIMQFQKEQQCTQQTEKYCTE